TGPGRVRFTVNGNPIEAEGDPNSSLLSVLREYFSCLSLKNGCEPQASCGCCLLLIDGKPRLSCTMQTSQFAGKHLQMLEGLPEEIRKSLADSFVQCGGVQCGFCIPGMAMLCYATCQENPNPSREQIAFDLRGHLWRCTGYVKIFDAIDQFASRQRGEFVEPVEQ